VKEDFPPELLRGKPEDKGDAVNMAILKNF